MSAPPAASQQGSASYTIVIAGVLALIVGAITLTFAFYPMVNTFMDSAIWTADSAAGSRFLKYMGGIWMFWGAIILTAIIMFVWVRTRQ